MVHIQAIEEKDLPDLSELYEELMELPTNKQKLAVAYAAVRRNDHYILLGAYAEGRLAGSVMGIVCHDLVGECRPFMVIENVIVSSRARRQGVGKQLLLAIEREARARDCYYIILVSGEKRKEAAGLYASLGFKDEPVEGYRKQL